VIGKEIRQRVINLFPSETDLSNKMVDLNLGVDTDLFKPVEPAKRKQTIETLCRQIAVLPRGRRKKQSQTFSQQITPELKGDALKKVLEKASAYNGKLTDEDVEEKLLSVNWEKENILLFVGRIISGKGLHSIITALPQILKQHPNTRLIVVGHGPLREPLEVFLWALRNDARELAFEIIRTGKILEGGTQADPLAESWYYLQLLKKTDALDAYFSNASQYLKENTVLFTGYLTHRELRFLFSASDVAIFPSVIAEAGPLVFLEALACGCFPMGTYFAGMAASIDSTQGYVPPSAQNLMKISRKPQNTVRDLIKNIDGALALNRKYASALRKLAVEKYDWSSIGHRFIDELENISK